MKPCVRRYIVTGMKSDLTVLCLSVVLVMSVPGSENHVGPGPHYYWLVFIHSGCHNRRLWTRWCINNGNLSLLILDGGCKVQKELHFSKFQKAEGPNGCLWCLLPHQSLCGLQAPQYHKYLLYISESMLVSWPVFPQIPVLLIIHMICSPHTLSHLVSLLLPLYLYLHYSLLSNILLVMWLGKEKDWIWPGPGEWDSGKEQWRSQEIENVWGGRIVWIIRKSSWGREGLGD